MREFNDDIDRISFHLPAVTSVMMFVWFEMFLLLFYLEPEITFAGFTSFNNML